MFWGPFGHLCRQSQPGRLPDSIRHGAEAEDILAAVRLDPFPGVPRPGLAGADGFQLKVFTQPRPQLFGREVSKPGNQVDA
jgi:hypothetical protein